MKNTPKQSNDKGVISNYFFVEDYIDEALEYFELTKEALGKGYHYSNHELASIYLCKTDYLLFFTGDTWLDRKLAGCNLQSLSLRKIQSTK